MKAVIPQQSPRQSRAAENSTPLSSGHAPQVVSSIAESPRIVAQRAQLTSAFGPAVFQLQPERQAENNTGLPDQLKSGVESLSGMSLDSVKVHYNSDKPAQLNALAYAQGTDIHVAPGQEQHLPHEAWHVVQQAQGRVQPTRQMKSGTPINDDRGLEHEADVMGMRALAGGGGEPGTARLPKSALAIQRTPVAQLGAKYDSVKAAAESDADNYDYEYKSVTEKDIEEGGEEIVAEYLHGGQYTGRDDKDLAPPKILVSGSYGVAEGVLVVPARIKSAIDIQTGEFIPNVMHELGHMVTGKTGDTVVKTDIPNLAKQARAEAAKDEYKEVNPNPDAWVEESRADLTGIYLRVAKGDIPTKDGYGQVSGEEADGEHPPGAFRMGLMTEMMQILGKAW